MFSLSLPNLFNKIKPLKKHFIFSIQLCETFVFSGEKKSPNIEELLKVLQDTSKYTEIRWKLGNLELILVILVKIHIFPLETFRPMIWWHHLFNAISHKDTSNRNGRRASHFIQLHRSPPHYNVMYFSIQRLIQSILVLKILIRHYLKIVLAQAN